MKEPQTTINCKNKKTLDYNQFIKTVHESINMNCEDIININDFYYWLGEVKTIIE